MTDLEATLDGSKCWLIRMNNLTSHDKKYRSVTAACSLLILLWFFHGTSEAPTQAAAVLRNFISFVLMVVAILGAYGLLSGIARTEIDYEKGVIRQFPCVPLVRKVRCYPIGNFSTVLSEVNLSRSGSVTVTVALTGRWGTVTLARFGDDGAFLGTNIPDHSEAMVLRERIAKRLQLRNLGPMPGPI